MTDLPHVGTAPEGRAAPIRRAVKPAGRNEQGRGAFPSEPIRRVRQLSGYIMTEFRIISETTRLWRLPLDTRELARVLDIFCRTIAAQGRPLPERLDLRLADDGAIADANARLMGCAGPTNILTFPGDASLPGELLLSLDTWERECRLYRQPPLSHLLRLLAHGMAHMTGLDHGPEMAALEQLCLQSLPESLQVRA